MIIVTGSELLSGVYADSHTFFLTRQLRPLGLQCVGSMSVDDKAEDIKAALQFSTRRAPLVIVTGGLGPTDSDLTREAIADFTGITLREIPEVIGQMARRFHVAPDRLRANVRRQAQAPSSGTYLQNANGTAVGLVFETADHVIVALPGPPRELQPMVRHQLVPYLSRRFGTHPHGCSLTIRFVGIGQSQIDQTLDHHISLPADMISTSQFAAGRVDFTFALPEDTAANRQRLEQLKQAVLKHLGQWVYATDQATSLEDRVIQRLAARHATLALAEVGSGGRLAAALTGAAGAGRVLSGALVAPKTEGLGRLLGGTQPSVADSSETVLQQLARAAARAAGSSWSVVVGPVVRSKDNGPAVVAVALHRPCGDEVIRLSAGRAAAVDMDRLVTRLLDLLRRRLQ